MSAARHTPGLHIRIEARIDLRTQDYSGKSHSAEFRCPACGKHQRQNRNFLGQNVLICDGEKFHRVNRSAWRTERENGGNAEEAARGLIEGAFLANATGEAS